MVHILSVDDGVPGEGSVSFHQTKKTLEKGEPIFPFPKVTLEKAQKQRIGSFVRVPLHLPLETAPVDDEGFFVAENPQPVLSVVASDAAVFGAAEGQMGIGDGDDRVIDDDGAGYEFCRHPPRPFQIIGPDAGV